MPVRFVKLFVAVGAVVGAGVVVPVGADAQPVASGATTVAGALHLPPTSCRSISVGCVGSFTGSMDGTAQGVVGIDAFEVTWKALPDDVTATIDDWDVACGATGAAVTRARGTGSASIEPGSMTGTWHRRTSGGTFPYAVTGVRVAFSFEWEGTGPAATMRLTSSAIDLDVAGIGVVRVVDGPQQGVAGYVPSTTGCTPGDGTTGAVEAAFALR